MHWTWAWTLAVSLLLAGCTGTAPVTGPEEDDAAQDPLEATDARPVLVDVRTETAFSWSGSTKEGAFVCNDPQGTSACPAGQQIQPDGAFQSRVSFEDNLTSAAFTLTWTPADPSQTGLVLAAYSATGTLLGVVDGTGPLTLELDGAGLPADSNLTLSVWPKAKAASTGPSVFVDATRQPFVVEGTIVTLDQAWQVPETDSRA